MYYEECVASIFHLCSTRVIPHCSLNVCSESAQSPFSERSIVEKHQKSCDRVRAAGAFFVLALRRFLLKSGLLRGEGTEPQSPVNASESIVAFGRIRFQTNTFFQLSASLVPLFRPVEGLAKLASGHWFLRRNSNRLLKPAQDLLLMRHVPAFF